jgi:hypothetical protein
MCIVLRTAVFFYILQFRNSLPVSHILHFTVLKYPSCIVHSVPGSGLMKATRNVAPRTLRYVMNWQ